MGPSQRGRGSRQKRDARRYGDGSIPARAGERRADERAAFTPVPLGSRLALSPASPRLVLR
jgi:hypothetical protein